MLPLSIVLAKGLCLLFDQNWSSVLIKVVLIYCFVLNFYDLNVRTDYWMDNRPMAYQFWYKNISKLDYSKYNKIQITSIIGDSRLYCKFYLGNVCNDKKFVFEGFDLSKDTSLSDGIYAGFAGEFVGPKFKNDIDPNWVNNLDISVYSNIGVMSLRDTIAYKYGNDIGIFEKKNEK
jgi:hypothetical protein